jgi:AcrR family transcriptional regulator
LTLVSYATIIFHKMQDKSMLRRVKDPQIRYAELLDASEKLFLKKGYEQTAVSDIVKSIAVAQGTFYYYFKSKEDALNAVIEAAMTRDVADLSSYLARSKKSPVEKLAYIINRSLHTFQERTRKFHFSMIRRNISGTYAIERQRRYGYKVMVPLYENIIEKGIKERVFQTKDPKEVAVFIMGMFDAMIYNEEGFASDTVITFRKGTVQLLIERLLGLDKGTLKL